MIEFVDTHTHLFVTEFDIDRADAVRRAVDAGVGNEVFHIVIVGFLKLGIPVAEALGGILGIIQGLAGFDIDHPPVV